jgi:predicted RecB family endonuclease
MWLRAVVGLSISQLALFGLFQADVVSPDWFQILEQYPPLAVILVVSYYILKETRSWLEKMLRMQQETYESQQKFVTALLSQIESKQNNMSDRIELLTQQMAVNTSTVSEIAKVDTIVSELIARLESK